MNTALCQVCYAVTFKLEADADLARFISLSRDLQAWLAKQEGFVRYELFASTERWMDTMIWRSRAAAELGNAAFLVTPLATEMMAMVEPGFHTLIAERVALGSDGALA